MRTGILFVLSGASGVGKGTIRSRLREQVPDIYHSVSVTSRAPRPGEREGMDYFFRTREQVEAMARAGELIEWVEYVGNYYGIPKRPVDEHLAQGVDVILEPETRGAKAVARLYPQAVLIFLVPPSLEALEQRLSFSDRDLSYLANLCHDCGECYYSCQYAPRMASSVARTGRSSCASPRCSSSSRRCATASSSRRAGSWPAFATTTSCSSPSWSRAACSRT